MYNLMTISLENLLLIKNEKITNFSILLYITVGPVTTRALVYIYTV